MRKSPHYIGPDLAVPLRATLDAAENFFLLRSGFNADK
jgi:hypothetical protein